MMFDGMLDQLQTMDLSVLLWIQEYLRADALDGFWKLVTSLGNMGWFWTSLSLALVCLGKGPAREAGIAALISLAACFVVTNLILKNVVARPRPFDAYAAVIPLIQAPRDFSFPSGHTCASFACAVVWRKMLPTGYGNAALLLACMIAFSRLYLGVHYPTDVLGGALVAVVVSSAVLRLRGNGADCGSKGEKTGKKR